MQDQRIFLEQLRQEQPELYLRTGEEINTCYEPTALALELEKRGNYPLIYCENVRNSKFPLVTNLLANREIIARSLGLRPSQLAAEFAERIQKLLPPKILQHAAWEENTLENEQLDLRILPLVRHFPIDAGPYITAGLVAAKDPVSGAETFGLHRMQYKSPQKLGISLHSRQRLWEYQRRAEKMGKNLEAAVIIGVHPGIILGSMALIPSEQSKYPAVGGLLGAPLEVAHCKNIDLNIPAWAEIIIEGEILSNIHEAEGPFAEFTGYACHRSTENVFHAKSLSFRKGAYYHDITPGLSADHVTVVAVQREGDVLAALRRTLPNVRAVHAPVSACGLFHAYVSIEKTAEGQPLQAIMAALAVDHNLKTVIVVDSDIDVYNEQQVLWAMATRLQADRGIITLPQQLGMGCTLDPSSDEQSRSAKLGIDATRPLSGFAPTLEKPPVAEARLLQLLGR